MEEDLRVGDLITLTNATQPAWFRKHGFGVIIDIEYHSDYGSIIYIVKFTKSEQVYRFSYDGVKRYE
jgi:uncharacterized membrane protein YkoI